MARQEQQQTKIELQEALVGLPEVPPIVKSESKIPAEEIVNYLLQINSTLSLQHLFKQFLQTLHPKVSIEHLEFTNTKADYHLCVGNKCTNTFDYHIKNESGESLGDLTISRSTPFNEHEIDIFEELISYTAFQVRNIIEYKSAIQSSLTDPLTGLGNRRALEKRMRQERELAKRTSRTFAVIAMDIDDFKKINDSFGHETGDIVLQEFAKQLSKLSREYDQVFRTGGEEFIVLTQQTEADTALNIAYRIKNQISNTQFLIKGITIQLTLSIGIAIYTNGDDPDSLLDRADQALYRAKNQGKNCVRT